MKVQHWKKLGQLFSPENNFEFMVSHAANPVAEYISENTFKIYFTSRDKNSRSHISSCTIDIEKMKVLEIQALPVLAPGALGLFDDSGTAMGCILNVGEKKFLYYLGWNLKVTVPWLNTIGLAIFNNEKNCFEKNSRAPMMDRSEEDPFSISYPSVLFDNGKYKMWYGSNLAWGVTQDEMQHVIKYAESEDGIHWNRTNKIAVGLHHKNEYALSKPMVLKTNDGFEMWYSYRANGEIKTYRIGFATSVDGIDWIRKDDEAGIDISVEGWDCEMICYPFVFIHNNKKYMLYNGNGYGKTGFGIAIQE
jgi:hypothetical protein